MRIDTRALTFEPTDAIREHTERRARFALGRFADRVRAVRVTIGDINGPKGGADKRATVVVQAYAGWRVVIEDTDVDAYAAVASALARAGRAVGRSLERQRLLARTA
ncbi:MAG: HPF/RaiA family ribosome-associated protein [Deltaproteobacteria bacterium]|nr:HPF/RaiA family ribosome-associated protein [Deltaproteobacteria bacterium]